MKLKVAIGLLLVSANLYPMKKVQKKLAKIAYDSGFDSCERLDKQRFLVTGDGDSIKKAADAIFHSGWLVRSENPHSKEKEIGRALESITGMLYREFRVGLIIRLKLRSPGDFNLHRHFYKRAADGSQYPKVIVNMQD